MSARAAVLAFVVAPLVGLAAFFAVSASSEGAVASCALLLLGPVLASLGAWRDEAEWGLVPFVAVAALLESVVVLFLAYMVVASGLNWAALPAEAYE